MLIPARAPGADIAEVDNLTEIATMLQERLAEKRYGPLLDWTLLESSQPTADQLLVWAECVLTAKILNEIAE